MMNNSQSTMNNVQLNGKGFTLLELLVVVAIIGILVSLGTVSYTQAQRKSRDSRRQSDLKALQNALEQYNGINTFYPGGTYPNLAALGPNYLPNGEPMDPKTGGRYNARTWSNAAYRVCADLESDGVFGGTNDDVCVTNLQ